jgi:glycosidase
MTVNPNYMEINAASQVSDPKSVFQCWKSVLELRKKHKDVFVYGDFGLVDEKNDKIFAYSRTSENGEVAVVICNFTPEKVVWENLMGKISQVLVSNSNRSIQDFDRGSIELAPFEGAVILLETGWN